MEQSAARPGSADGRGAVAGAAQGGRLRALRRRPGERPSGAGGVRGPASQPETGGERSVGRPLAARHCGGREARRAGGAGGSGGHGGLLPLQRRGRAASGSPSRFRFTFSPGRRDRDRALSTRPVAEHLGATKDHFVFARLFVYVVRFGAATLFAVAEFEQRREELFGRGRDFDRFADRAFGGTSSSTSGSPSGS